MKIAIPVAERPQIAWNQACENPVNGAGNRSFDGGPRPYSQRRSNPTMTVQSGTIRLAVIDTDSAFTTVLGKRLEAAGWEARFSPGPIPLDEIVSMKLNVVDPRSRRRSAPTAPSTSRSSAARSPGSA